MAQYFVRMKGDQRLTAKEAEALLYLAERGWKEVKAERSSTAPYGPLPLTDEAAKAFVDSLEKLDTANREVRSRITTEEGAPPLDLVVRGIPVEKRPPRRRGGSLDCARDTQSLK